jgi:Transcriptional regulators
MTEPNINVIAENLISIYPLLYKSISKPLRVNSPITPGGMFVLGSLKRHGTLSMSEIGKCMAIPKPHVTVVVDKLIEEGFVERQNDPKDRRVINIALTEKGSKNFEEIKRNSSESLKEKLTLLDEQELEELLTASQKVKEILLTILSKE